MAELLRQDRLRIEDIQMRLSGNADDQESKKKHAAKTVSTTMNYGPVTRETWARQTASPRYE
jgi:hypothetical protein